MSLSLSQKRILHVSHGKVGIGNVVIEMKTEAKKLEIEPQCVVR